MLGETYPVRKDEEVVGKRKQQDNYYGDKITRQVQRTPGRRYESNMGIRVERWYLGDLT